MFDTKTRRIQSIINSIGDNNRSRVDGELLEQLGRKELYFDGTKEVVTPAYLRPSDDFFDTEMISVPEERMTVDVPDHVMRDRLGYGQPQNNQRGGRVQLTDAEIKRLGEIDRVGFDTPVQELTPRQQKAVQEAREILDEKVQQYGLAAVGGGLGLGAVSSIVNHAQGDDNGGFFSNPTAMGGLGAVAGAGIGGAIGMGTYQPALERELLAKEQQMGSDAFADYYGSRKEQIGRIENGRRGKEMRRRGSRAATGAAIGAAGMGLLQLTQNLKDDLPSARYY